MPSSYLVLSLLRIKQKCIAWGPAWLGDNVPQLINTNAIKLLELDRSEPSLCPSYSDPPLSPISLLSEEEREDTYPCVHVELQPNTETTLLLTQNITQNITQNNITQNITQTFNSSMEHISYKPQAFTFHEEEEEEEDKEIVDQTSSDLLEDFFEGLLPNVHVDVSDCQVELSLDCISKLCWAKNDQTNLDSMEKMTIEDKTDVISDLMLVQTSEASFDNDALVDFSDQTEELTGYFPQISTLISPT